MTQYKNSGLDMEGALCGLRPLLQEKFASGKDLSLLSHSINRFLLLHKGNFINFFRLRFPAEEQFRPEIDKWIKFAVEKRVKELHLYIPPVTLSPEEWLIKDKSILKDGKVYTLPPYVFSCDTLTILILYRCILNVPSGCVGFNSLKTLKLAIVEITHYTFEMMLHGCPMLEELHMLGCYGLRSDLRSFGTKATDLKIKTFKQIGCYGWDHSGLFVSKLAHLQMLTICHFKAYQLPRYLLISPITLQNLIELQYGVSDLCGLDDLYNLFRGWNFPCLEKLKIEWIPDFEPRNNWVMKSSGVFHRLKTIKMNGFYGGQSLRHVVKFLLQKAIVLETMVLITPKEVIEGCVGKHSVYKAKLDVASLSLLRERLALLPKVSTKAQVVLCERC